ncbi:uncharacterized protein LOC111311837 [Durio zibethinus]|uniref:Uncharacterized protein LOC111311837 n=1 Tax=Durio zibethinus TaxID=66656 RepID=A0A6P6ARB7_DURZI|nr:uncharacterized protein LOC111311837 [Durio zibethinus]XP_022767331.1 uncharacterized protein LOC111311837 [Durio zibethinus]XP_022767332.1 uncharacterized protein LOC111311837 [Durio zibethinus]XP_022767333.1 uncharacterized protein LOC111311837 [Durio zibethinus]
MTDHHPRFGQLRSTSQILKKTTVQFTAHPFTFLFLSFLLLSFRSLVESGSLLLTSFIDRDPSFKSLLSRVDLHPAHPHARLQPTLRHTRRPFLHLTRVGTLDDDFFSTDDDHRDRSLLGSFSNRPLNDTPLILSNFDTKLGFSHFVEDNGILLPEIVRYGVKFKTTTFDYENSESEQQEERIVDYQFVYKGLELSHRDAAALFFLVSFLSAAYGWVILGFTAIYSLVLGVLFVTVVNGLIGRFVSFFGAFWDGSKVGLKRLTGFVLMKWAVRDAVTQLLGLWYFGEIEDHYSFFMLFVRLKLLPFSVMAPWIRGYEKEISGFLFTWFLMDTLVSFAFSLAAWIAIVDSRRTGREIIKEGYYLMSTLLNQAIQIKCYEAILGGSLARWVLAHIGGEFFATVIQAALEVYFMVAWLIFYFVVRCREANAEGRRYGRRELEALIDGLT